MLGSPGAQQGEVSAERRASRRGRKRQREGDSAAHTEVGAGGAEGEEEEAEEVGGVGRSPAPVARRAAVCSLPATRRALIRRPEPTRQPLPPRRPRHAGPEPAPPAPAGAARSGGRTQAGAGSETSRPPGGLCGPGSTHHPWFLSVPGRWARGGDGPGEPRVATGGTGGEVIIGRGRVQGPVLRFRKCTPASLHSSPRQRKASPERTPGTSRS